MCFPDKLQKKMYYWFNPVFSDGVMSGGIVQGRLYSNRLNCHLKITCFFLFDYVFLFLRSFTWDEIIYMKICFLGIFLDIASFAVRVYDQVLMLSMFL